MTTAWLTTPSVGDLDHRVEQRLAVERAHGIDLHAVTRLTVDALVATEDERYWHHSGIDVIGLMRAIPYDVTHLSLAQGGSTLTEQLAKNIWLGGHDQNVWAKVQDMALALKLDRGYSKSAILAAYLNTAYFGDGAYGVDRASRRYFGRAPLALDAGQATLLVGLLQAPTRYDPYTHPSLARRRQADVLRSLVRVGKLGSAQATRLLSSSIRLADGRKLPGIGGEDLSPGPAVAWLQMMAAIAAALAGIGAALTRRLTRGSHALASHLAAVLSVCLLGGALVTAVRSLRVL